MEAIVGQHGVAIGAGLNPEGIVQVTSERRHLGRWRPGSGRRAGRVTRIDGLVLTVERVRVEHRSAAVRAAEEGRNH